MCTRLSCLVLLLSMIGCAHAQEAEPDRLMMVCQPVQASQGVVLLCVEVHEDELGGQPVTQRITDTAPVTSISL